MYRDWQFKRTVSSDDVSELSETEQKELMSQWFHENFEDPVECLPYESREGGYIWVFGGPCEPDVVLTSEFGRLVAHGIIDELVEELEQISFEWSPVQEEDEEDFSHYAESIHSDEDPNETLHGALDRIQRILRHQKLKDVDDEQALLQLSLVGVISAVEAFFSDLFLCRMSRNDLWLRRFVEVSPEMRKRRLTMSEIFERREGLDKEVKKFLSSFLWHRIESVIAMYRTTFRVEFPAFMPLLGEAVNRRHSIVHRGGKDREGNALAICELEVMNLMTLVREKSTELRVAIDAAEGAVVPDEPF